METYYINGTDIVKKLQTLVTGTKENIKHIEFSTYEADINNIAKYMLLFGSEDESDIRTTIKNKDTLVVSCPSTDGIVHIRDKLILEEHVDSFVPYNHKLGLFDGFVNLETVNLEVLDTYEVTDMTAMFKGCTSLKEMSLIGLDLGNVEYMDGLFENCSNLVKVDMSNLDTRSLKSLSHLFSNCIKLKYMNFDNMDSNSLEDVSYMCYNCKSLGEVYLASLYTPKLKKCESMFNGCTKLTKVDLTNFTTDEFRHMTDMIGMFRDCKVKKIKTKDPKVIEAVKGKYEVTKFKDTEHIFDDMEPDNLFNN